MFVRSSRIQFFKLGLKFVIQRNAFNLWPGYTAICVDGIQVELCVIRGVCRSGPYRTGQPHGLIPMPDIRGASV